jgi:Polysaccharide pyruvyl transferase
MQTDDLMLPHLPQKNFVVVTPYLVNPATAKKVNVGDGFIMDSALKLIGATPTRIFSSRISLTEDDIAVINASQFVLVAGANTLKDTFEILPRFTLGTLEKIKVPVVLCGLGHYGTEEATRHGFDGASQAIFREIFSRFPYVSVRCDASKKYMLKSLPEMSDRILMTSCPVAHSVDNINFSFTAKERYSHFVCTITDRSDLPIQIQMLRNLRYIVKADRMTLALHQDYSNRDLWSYAKFFGYEVFRSDSYRDFLELYKTVDLHVGNRVHAHLKCLSYGVRSVLTPFDLRHQFFADSLAFPILSDVTQLAEDRINYAGFLERRSAAQSEMAKFVECVRSLLLR